MLAMLYIPRRSDVRDFAPQQREDCLLITAAFLAATNRSCEPQVIARICSLDPFDRFVPLEHLFNSIESKPAENGVRSEHNRWYSRASYYSRRFGEFLVELYYGDELIEPNFRIRTQTPSWRRPELLECFTKALTALPDGCGWVCSVSEQGWFPHTGRVDDRKFASSLAELQQLLTASNPESTV